MMAIHLQEELNTLKRMILAQSALVEESVQKAVQALERGDNALADSVINLDNRINHHEVELEEECLKVLALHQPVATDLRFIVSVIKINSDLERIGDVAVNVAKRTLAFAELKKVEAPFDFPLMAKRVLAMLDKSLTSLVNLDAAMAQQVIDDDDQIDELHRQTYGLVKQELVASSHNLEALLLWLAVSRHMERIADLAAHIAEDVVYMIEGQIVRHRSGG
ncbi:phosphate signaling complex protein PhoU [uncultured Desulfuromonas sp.]|uniref:phosphate signaling complex protein PhoU n=1 Tax=uncultured Desulfuromonas sp. TaxID=181013 RepID=UPI002AAA64E3|nr:phosphate signaling complex protein PhoU [uncultured Desulfuromonas sp.]